MSRRNVQWAFAPSSLFIFALLVCGCDRRTSQRVPPPDFPQDLVAVAETQPPLIDEDYCFRLAAPNNKWKLLDDREVQQLLPDAVAGMMAAGGFFGVVIVEPMPTEDLLLLAELLRDNSVMLDGGTTSIEEVSFQDRPAMRFQRSGLTNGMDLTFEHLVFVHQEFAYQLVCWGTTARFTRDLCQQFYDAFEITDGQVKGRASAIVKEFDGVGCRVVDGVFQSAVYRLTAQPKDDWQLMVGASLGQSFSDAEVGLQNAVKAAYLVVLPEFVAEQDRAAFTKAAATSIVEELELDPATRQIVEFDVDGSPTAFEVYRSLSIPLRYYSGIHFIDDVAYRFLLWHPDRSVAEMRQELRTAVAQIGFLDQPTTDSLTQKLLEKNDRQNIVGLGYSLRNGIYRDFERRVMWTKPHGFWRVLLGDEARASNEFCSLAATEPALGLELLLVDEPSAGFTPETYHQTVMDNMFGEADEDDRAAPKTIRLGDRAALCSNAILELEPVDVSFRVVTILHGDQAHQIVVSGAGRRFPSQGREIEETIRGFRFLGEEMVPIERPAAGHYRDHRIGWEMILEESNWELKENLRPRLIRWEPSFSSPGRSKALPSSGSPSSNRATRFRGPVIPFNRCSP